MNQLNQQKMGREIKWFYEFLSLLLYLCEFKAELTQVYAKGNMN